MAWLRSWRGADCTFDKGVATRIAQHQRDEREQRQHDLVELDPGFPARRESLVQDVHPGVRVGLVSEGQPRAGWSRPPRMSLARIGTAILPIRPFPRNYAMTPWMSRQ